MGETGEEAGLSLHLSVLEQGERKKRGYSGGEGNRRRGKEAPWVNCAASLSPKPRRKSVSVSCSCLHAWVCVVGDTNWIDILSGGPGEIVCMKCNNTMCTVCARVSLCVSYLYVHGCIRDCV